jgi:hypothetical protein
MKVVVHLDAPGMFPAACLLTPEYTSKVIAIPDKLAIVHDFIPFCLAFGLASFLATTKVCKA